MGNANIISSIFSLAEQEKYDKYKEEAIAFDAIVDEEILTRDLEYWERKWKNNSKNPQTSGSFFKERPVVVFDLKDGGAKYDAFVEGQVYYQVALAAACWGLEIKQFEEMKKTNFDAIVSNDSDRRGAAIAAAVFKNHSVDMKERARSLAEQLAKDRGLTLEEGTDYVAFLKSVHPRLNLFEQGKFEKFKAEKHEFVLAKCTYPYEFEKAILKAGEGLRKFCANKNFFITADDDTITCKIEKLTSNDEFVHLVTVYVKVHDRTDYDPDNYCTDCKTFHLKKDDKKEKERKEAKEKKEKDKESDVERKDEDEKNEEQREEEEEKEDGEKEEEGKEEEEHQ